MKLANNMLAAAVIVLSSEVIAMGAKAGLNPRQMCEVINAGSGRNSATQDKFPRSVLPGTFDFGFATGLSWKDVRLCLQEADAQGTPMPVGAEVFQILSVTKAKYGADSDFTSHRQDLRRVGGRRDARLNDHMAATGKTVARDERPLAVRMAHAVGAYSWQDLTPEVLAKAKLCIYDLLSSALTSSDVPWSRQAAAVARANSGGAAHGAGIIGTADVVSVQDAAFANGVIGHQLVRDDMHVGSVSHLGTVLVPALLALATTKKRQRQGLPDGARRGLRGRRQGRPHDPRRRSLEDVPADRHHGPDRGGGRRREAARTFAGADGHRARARRERGRRLQRVGRHGRQRDVLPHGPRGAQRASRPCSSQPRARTRRALRSTAKRASSRRSTSRLQPVVPELFADRPEILAVFFKPVPACNFAQSPAQAALNVAKRKRLRAADIERVTVNVTRAAALYPGCNVSGPFEHILQAKMSIHYNVASALVHGDTAERNYVPQQNPDVLQARDAACGSRSTRTSRRRFRPQQGAGVIVHTRAGDVLEERVDDVVPTNADGVRERFVAAAAERLGQKQAKELDRLIATLETVTDARELAQLATLRRA